MSKDIDKLVNTIICGDCLSVMRGWPDGFIDCCVTSPPYWGLRDYGVEGQLGLEKTPEEYVAKMIEVFREVKRVLKKEGTLWLNLGDSYANTGCDSSKVGGFTGERIRKKLAGNNPNDSAQDSRPRQRPPGLKPKDLCGIPWRVAFALQADGWYLRQDIIWHKPNPMPESVTDRCTKAHEYIFLLSKSAKYYYDQDAIRVEQKESNDARPRMGQGPNTQYNQKRKSWHDHKDDLQQGNRIGPKEDHPKGKNKRSVWTISLSPYSAAHFATFPPKLIEPCILAGCPVGGIVFDPFMGSGTVAEVAIKLKRNYVGCELNPEYIGMGRVKAAETGVPVAEQRIGQMAMFEDKE